jgi:hypothetical protein
VLFAEAHNARIGRPRSVRLFTDLSSYDAVIAKMQCVLDNYEGVPALNAQAPQVFIDTMLQLHVERTQLHENENVGGAVGAVRGTTRAMAAMVPMYE